METLEKIAEEIKKLYDVEDRLSNILEHAGQDSEAKYTQKNLDLIDDLRDLSEGLLTLLDNHISTIMDLEFEVEG